MTARESAVLAMAAQLAFIFGDIAARTGPEHRPGPSHDTKVCGRAHRGLRSLRPKLRLEIAVIDRSFGRKPRWSTAVCG